jgi:hypothetical protein
VGVLLAGKGRERKERKGEKREREKRERNEERDFADRRPPTVVRNDHISPHCQ